MFYVLQLRNQRLLRGAAGAGIPFDCALVNHNCKRKAGMIFRFGHDELRCLVDRVIGAVPVDDHASYASADHVRNLALDLRGIGRAIADIHMIVLAKPEH